MNGVQAVVGTSQTTPSMEEDLPVQSSDGRRRTCIREDGDDYYHVKFLYLSSIFYFLAVGLSSVSLIFLINYRIAGDASEPSSKSIFVQTTVVFLTNARSFLFLRYNAGMGDFVGRKPVLCASAFALIVTRLLYSIARLPAHFYLISILAGATESFYFSTLAWVCDIFPSHAERSKYYGIFTGIGGFAGVVIGAPLGAALSIAVSPTTPFLFSAVFSFSSLMVTLLNPCCDTLTLQSMDASAFRMITASRALPKSMSHFFCTHFPISKSSIDIVKQSSQVLDWATFSIAQWTVALLFLILVQFLLKVFAWSPALSSLCLLFMGLSLGIFVPILQNHFEPISLSFYSMGVQVLGYLLLSIAGTGVEKFHSIGIVGLTLTALGLAWVPCSQSIIMSGYDFGKQGVVSGLVGQVADFATFPGYLISLSFTFNLDRGPGQVYWPGCAFGISSVILVLSMFLHHYAHGVSVFTLKHRSHFKRGESVEIPVLSKVVSFTMVQSETKEFSDDETSVQA